MGATAVATAIPAWNVTHMPPLELLRPYGLRAFSRHGQGFAVGAVSFGLGAGMVELTRVSPAAGLAATSLVFLGVAMMLPGILLQFAVRVRPMPSGKDAPPRIPIANRAMKANRKNDARPCPACQVQTWI